MAITKMVALKAHRYADRQYKPGDTYSVDGESNLRLVTALGWSEVAPAPTDTSTDDDAIQTVRVAAKKTATKAMAPAAKVAAKRTGYRTRVMQAEATSAPADDPAADQPEASADD